MIVCEEAHVDRATSSRLVSVHTHMVACGYVSSMMIGVLAYMAHRIEWFAWRRAPHRKTYDGLVWESHNRSRVQQRSQQSWFWWWSSSKTEWKRKPHDARCMADGQYRTNASAPTGSSDTHPVYMSSTLIKLLLLISSLFIVYSSSNTESLTLCHAFVGQLPFAR